MRNLLLLHVNNIDTDVPLQQHSLVSTFVIWASSQEKLSSGCPTKWVSNHAPQLQRLASELKFRVLQVYILYFSKSEQQRRWSDCADAQAGLRLCCTQTPEDRLSRDEAHILPWRYNMVNVQIFWTLFFFCTEKNVGYKGLNWQNTCQKIKDDTDQTACSKWSERGLPCLS